MKKAKAVEEVKLEEMAESVLDAVELAEVNLFDKEAVQRAIDSGVTTKTIIEGILEERGVDMRKFLVENVDALVDGDPMKLAELASRA